MTTFRKSLIAILGAVATVLVLSAPASAAPAPTDKPAAAEMALFAEQTGQVWNEESQELLAAWDCPSGRVCFYSGAAGTGGRCSWEGSDDNWLAGDLTCLWSRSDSVESVRNNGNSTAFNGVRYYTGTDFNPSTSVGCIPRGARGTLNTSRLLRSHLWVTGACG
ncbi:hypothetical protein GCM10029976_069760 [Kribbella albertanoniae]|uniref:Peptidase inhibitor family I36 protein n=1 Tax=Kribbella albertanoniae TaxID=1266829 RepID=A0A4R4PUR6_9ACTN|nr:peptidase inhibitor family I36 protein [Kribbella albertanoniae]TDC26138.1 hypothetical protein E1261_23025 [Kribbella albertanoniae]